MDKKITIIAARYNEAVMNGLLGGARRGLREAGVDEKNISLIRVPGSLEIPLACTWAIAHGTDAIIALGAIHKGETIHDEVIAHSVASRVLNISVKNGLPIGFGVMTYNTELQALARSADDDKNRGYEAAVTVLEMLKLKESNP